MTPLDAGRRRSSALIRTRAAVLRAALLMLACGPTSVAQAPPRLEVKRLGPALVELRWERMPGALGYAIYRWLPTRPAPERRTDQPIVATRYRDSLPAGSSASYQLVAFLTDGRTLRSHRQRLPAPPPADQRSPSCYPAKTCASDRLVTPP